VVTGIYRPPFVSWEATLLAARRGRPSTSGEVVSVFPKIHVGFIAQPIWGHRDGGIVVREPGGSLFEYTQIHRSERRAVIALWDLVLLSYEAFVGHFLRSFGRPSSS